jgi:hypothetical protein
MPTTPAKPTAPADAEIAAARSAASRAFAAKLSFGICFLAGVTSLLCCVIMDEPPQLMNALAVACGPGCFAFIILDHRESRIVTNFHKMYPDFIVIEEE